VSSTNDIPFGDSLLIDSVELRAIRMPLVAPFETSFGRLTSRLALLTRVGAGGMVGWGEAVPLEAPVFNGETTQTVRHAIRDFLAPALIGRRISSLGDVACAFERVRGNQMAKAGLELACADLAARATLRPVSTLLGGTRDRVAVGVSLGIQPSVEKLLEMVARHVALGYQRIKLKIKPGVDYACIEAVRERHPDILLSVDANSAYTLDDRALLQSLDIFNLLMIEQPLAAGDLVDHATLQPLLRTPICLDESITSPRDAVHALQLGSCRIINIKAGRVGGYSSALAIHDMCRSQGVPVWCGGMVESGIGRAHNLALASLPGFTLPGDISASSRFYTRDIVDPPLTIASDGTAAVPTGPGIGVEVDVDYIDAHAQSIDRMERSSAAVSLS
jgi:O-succinylbenzoate synthase